MKTETSGNADTKAETSGNADTKTETSGNADTTPRTQESKRLERGTSKGQVSVNLDRVESLRRRSKSTQDNVLYLAWQNVDCLHPISTNERREKSSSSVSSILILIFFLELCINGKKEEEKVRTGQLFTLAAPQKNSVSGPQCGRGHGW